MKGIMMETAQDIWGAESQSLLTDIFAKNGHLVPFESGEWTLFDSKVYYVKCTASSSLESIICYASSVFEE